MTALTVVARNGGVWVVLGALRVLIALRAWVREQPDSMPALIPPAPPVLGLVPPPQLALHRLFREPPPCFKARRLALRRHLRAGAFPQRNRGTAPGALTGEVRRDSSDLALTIS